MEKMNVIAYMEPQSLIAEAYRSLCTNVLAGIGEKKLIEITCAVNESEASMVVANLAVVMAQAGKKVLLVDCNLRNSKQHEIFGLKNSGLTDCIVAAQDYKAFVQRTGQQNLEVLTAGTVVTNPMELLLSNPMRGLLNAIREAYDIILLVVPAAGYVADAAALGRITDGAILVLTNREDKVEQAQKAKDALTKAGVFILGCVLDKVKVL